MSNPLYVPILNGNADPMVLKAENAGTQAPSAIGANQMYVPHSYDEVLDNLVNATRTYITGTVATSGDNTLVAAPGAGNFFRILTLELQNESTTETLVILKSGATNRRRVLLPGKERVFVSYPIHAPLDLAANAAMILNLGGANSVGYNVVYRVMAV